MNDKRFDPIKYFGGYYPSDIETGVIRKVINDVFSLDYVKDPKKLSSNSVKDLASMKAQHMQQNSQHTSSSQAYLNPSICPSLTEISESLQKSQHKINHLMKNLKNIEAHFAPEKEYKWNSKMLTSVQTASNNSYLKHNHPKVLSAANAYSTSL